MPIAAGTRGSASPSGGSPLLSPTRSRRSSQPSSGRSWATSSPGSRITPPRTPRPPSPTNSSAPRPLAALPKQKAMEKARETLEIHAALAHRLGIHAIKWELEDLAFATLHPRKYEEIKELVAQQRVERETYVTEAGRFLAKELGKV